MRGLHEENCRLRAMGIRPNSALVADYIRAAEAEEPIRALEQECASPAEKLATAPEPPVFVDQSTSVHSSKSNLESVHRETGRLEHPPGPRKPGRPRIIASWSEKVAETMVDGTSLETALAMSSLSLSKSEMRPVTATRFCTPSTPK